MPHHGRVLWRPLGDHSICTVFWNVIDVRSFVVITVAEAELPTEPMFEMPVNRFIGLARHMHATNIAPFPGGVRFSVEWAGFSPAEPGDFPYLNVWTDITVFDRTKDDLELVVNDSSEADMRRAAPG